MDSVRSAINSVLNSVYEQQRKAETKHAGLLAFNGAVVSALLKYYTAVGLASGDATCSVVFAILGGLFLLAGVVLSAWSFVPKLGTTPADPPNPTNGSPCEEKEEVPSPSTKKNCELPQKINTNDKPIMSFLAAKEYKSGKEYLDVFVPLHGGSDAAKACADAYNKQLAAQIVYNSKIVWGKYSLFTLASVGSIIGLVFTLTSFFINLIA